MSDPITGLQKHPIFEMTSAGLWPTVDIGESKLHFGPSGVAQSAMIQFTGVTLPADMNVIRGAGLSPTRTSGWISFQGEIEDTPAVCYPMFSHLATKGVAVILGVGSFCDMNAGASCKTLRAQQNIVSVAEGATVLDSAAAAASGVFATWNKTSIDKATFESGAVAAVQFLSFQADVTDVSAEDTAIWNVEVASGKIRSLIHLLTTGGAGASNLLEMDDVEPVIDDPTLYHDPHAETCEKGLRVKIGSLYYMIPLYVAD